MSIRITRVLTDAERIAMDEDAVARGFWRSDPRIFVPGMAWYQPWYWDPSGERVKAGEYVMLSERPADPNKRGFLSPHYWRDWAHIRPPVCVVCPNGEQWEIDRWSSNGTGWTVTGTLPDITCSPSIVVEGYHGFLSKGVFTADIDGRGPVGIARAITPRT